MRTSRKPQLREGEARAKALRLLALLSAGTTTLSGLASGCTGDDTTSGPSDAGKDVTTDTAAPDTGGQDGSAIDSGGDVRDSAPPGKPPTFAIVHAAPNLGTLRICTKIGGIIATPSPSAPVPALAGSPVPLSDADALAYTLYSSQDYLILDSAIPTDAGADGGTPSCGSILGGAAGVPTSAIFPMALVPPQFFKPGKAYLIAIVGCSSKDDGGTGRCGSDYDGGITVREEFIELDRTVAAGNDAIGAQVVHLSPEFQAAVPTGVRMGYGVVTDAGPDAALAYTAVGGGLNYAPKPVIDPAQAVVIPGALKSFSRNAVSLFGNVDGGVPNAPLGVDFTLDNVALLSTGDPDAAVLFQPKLNYTFIILGDPAGTIGVDEHAFRIIAVPNGP